MGRTRGLAPLFVSLLVFWLLLNGAVARDLVVVGVLVTAILAQVFAGNQFRTSESFKLALLTRLDFIICKELGYPPFAPANDQVKPK